MFLHIGDNNSIYKKDIVAILDKKVIDQSDENKGLIKVLDKSSIDSSKNDIKTYIVVCKNGDYQVYGSNISSITLLNRG